MQRDSEVVKIDVGCVVAGDVVLECVHMECDDTDMSTVGMPKGDDTVHSEQMIFRIAFNTNYTRSNMLMLTRHDADILWNGKERFSPDFRAEVWRVIGLSFLRRLEIARAPMCSF